MIRPNRFPASYSLGAGLLRQLQQLQPGQAYRMQTSFLSDVEVPADPLDRQSPDFIAKWMHDRMPFYSVLHRDPLGGWFEIERPAAAPSS